VLGLADRLRQEAVGDVVRYVVNRNINYTNFCVHACSFCAFSKGGPRQLAGQPYDLSVDEISRRAAEAWQRGATEVCLQGGIHPDYTGETYLEILAAVQRGAPGLHIHAFSPLEVTHGARTLGLGLHAYLERLRAAGLGSLPGTAAEILDDDVRRIICPDKLSTREWLEVIAAAHEVGLKTTSTIMFGSIEGYGAWARHLLALREAQERSGGITEFVPLPFVSSEAPLYRKGRARRGPSLREALLMHAVARIALFGRIDNIQVSWVKMGRSGVLASLGAGANDLGGTLMNESISRAAGACNGQELPPAGMREWIVAAGRTPLQRTTLYGVASDERRACAEHAPPLTDIVLTAPVRRRAHTEISNA
jgi:FO synthase